jgi:hypothetical protein
MSAHTANTIAVVDGIGSVDSSLFFNKICCHLLHQFLFHHLLCCPLHCLVFFNSCSDFICKYISEPDSAFGCNSTFLAAIWKAEAI